MTTLADAVARANLHGDPLLPVLEHIEASIARLEKIGEREPLSEEALGRLCRFAAAGAQTHALEMIRVAQRRVWWLRATWWAISLAAAAAAGYVFRGVMT